MDTISGIPAHPLFVHLTVVAIPLAAILGILAVLWPAARRRIGIAAPIVALVAVVMTPLTTSAGESLEKKVGPNPYLHDHTELGDKMIIAVAPLFVFMVVFWALNSDWIMSRVTARVPAVPARAVTISSIVAAVIVVVFAVGSLILVYKVGESGARSVWLG